jgi:hypothetical protein
LTTIAGYLGKVLKVDSATLAKTCLMYARILVDMNISEGFPEELFFSNENGETVAQQVQYDWGTCLVY